MGSLSPLHWLVVMAIVFLLFGNRLPTAMRSLGQGIAEFKKGLQGIDEDLNTPADGRSCIVSRKSSPTAIEAAHGPADVPESQRDKTLAGV